MRTRAIVSGFVTSGLSRHRRVNRATMDKYTQSVDRLEYAPHGGAALVAETIQADFRDLIGIFDHQIAGLSEAEGPIRSHLEEARSAAVRGLQLSDKLIEVLRASN